MDTMIGAFLLDPSRIQYGIDRLALEFLNFRKVPTSDLIGKGRGQISMQKVDLDKIAAYAAEDADVALRLAEVLESKLAQTPVLRKLCDEVETPLIEVLVEMEANGIAIDPAILKEQSRVLGERIEELRSKIFQCAGAEFNPDSPKQLADILFTRLKLPVIKRTKTGSSTDVEVLEKLSDKHDCPRLVLDYRSLMKLKNTYLDNLTAYVNPKTGRIHASFNQIGAATGRLSCSDPNLQNIPIRTDEGRRIRLAFVPGDPQRNVLLTADYSQIELRILAHFTQEPALLAAFAADEDIHRAVAAEVFAVPLEKVTRDQRGQAKTINFGIIYGVSAFGLARRIDGLTVQSAADLIAAYNKRFPSIQRFLDQCVMEARTRGYVQTILGRRRPIPEINSSIVSLRNAGERMAINSVVQGSAADMIKMAMNNIHRRLKQENRPSRMLLQVHDELVFETPAEAVESEQQMIRQEMIGAIQLSVPLKVEIGWGKNWQEVK
jgi:DNA polymerase-1